MHNIMISKMSVLTGVTVMITSRHWSIGQKVAKFWPFLIHQGRDYVSTIVYSIECTNAIKNNNLYYFCFVFLASASKRAVRNAFDLNRFIYIACSPKAALDNWIDFGRNVSKTLRGDPFILKEAAGVDMFPHTEHSEMILLFERAPKPVSPGQPTPSTSKQSESPQPQPQPSTSSSS